MRTDITDIEVFRYWDDPEGHARNEARLGYTSEA